MQSDIIKKFGKEVVDNFWIFVSQLEYDSKKKDASSVRKSILKRLNPTSARTYKELGDELAFSLYRSVYPDKKNTYLYAAFEAVSKGLAFYQKCWTQPEVIEPVVESLDRFNNFSTVLPTDDDYYSVNAPTPEEVWEDYEDYDVKLENNGNKKTKKAKLKDVVAD